MLVVYCSALIPFSIPYLPLLVFLPSVCQVKVGHAATSNKWENLKAYDINLLFLFWSPAERLVKIVYNLLFVLLSTF